MDVPCVCIRNPLRRYHRVPGGGGILGIVQGIFFLKFDLLQDILFEKNVVIQGILCWLSCTFS